MSRDTRNYGGDYDERDLDGRAGPPRGRRPNGGGGGGRGPSDPSMRRPNGNVNGNGSNLMRPPYGSRGSGPRNGGPRSYEHDSADYPDYPDQPSRRSRAEYRNGPPSRTGGRSRSGDSYEMETSRAPRKERRGFGAMVGEMSRQLSAMVRGTGRAMQREAAQIAAAGSRRSVPMTPTPEMLAQIQSDLPRYRRSRIRIRARKWRLERVRANPVGYAIGVAAVVVAAVSILGGGGAGAVYAYNYYDIHRPAIQSIINNAVSGQNTVIYDRNGQILYNVRSDSGYNYYVPLSQIGQTIQDATIDTEDHSFYSPTNIGVDFQGTLRALLADATHGGAADQGGSTITQQLVKRLILHDPSKQVQRKLNEMILAVGLNANYSKSQILEMYLNTIDYGDQNQGIEAAARNFFGLKQKQENGKVVLANQQLSIAQAAILAGLPNNPTYYLPIAFSCDKAPCDTSQWAKPCTNDPTQGVCDPSADYVNNWGQLGHEWIVWRRARVVLQSMNNYGTITDSQYLDALNQVKDILVNQEIKHWAGLTDGSAADTTKLAPSFVDEVLNELVNQFGFSADTLPTAGLRVYTTLDYKLEQYVEQNIDYYINKDHSTPGASYKRNECGHDCAYPLAKTANAHDAAAVVIDPYTGDVLAMMGTAKYNDKNPLVAGNVNVATSPRSLGSSMKGIVYATAFQMGWTPSVMMQDTPICMPGTGGSSQDYGGTPGCRNQPVYVPHNYTGDGYNGYVPVRLALANSLNIPAVEAMSFVGDTPELANNFITMARRLGITGDVKDANGNVTTYGMEQSRVGPTTALGTQSVPLIQLTNAYAAMADSGKHVPYRTILRIEDSAGDAWNAPTPKPAQVISPQAAYMLTSVLSDNAARIAGFNFNNPLEFPDFPSFQIASKTGTGSGKVGPSDIVTIGYSPYLAVGVWVGNANGADMTPGIIGIAGAGYIFHDVMDYALKTYKWTGPSTFPIPPDMAMGAFGCNAGLAPYQGEAGSSGGNGGNGTGTGTGTGNSSAPSCAVRGNLSPSLPIYKGYGPPTPGSHPDIDWYIQGQQPLNS